MPLLFSRLGVSRASCQQTAYAESSESITISQRIPWQRHDRGLALEAASTTGSFVCWFRSIQPANASFISGYFACDWDSNVLFFHSGRQYVLVGPAASLVLPAQQTLSTRTRLLVGMALAVSNQYHTDPPVRYWQSAPLNQFSPLAIPTPTL